MDIMDNDQMHSPRTQISNRKADQKAECQRFMNKGFLVNGWCPGSFPL